MYRLTPVEAIIKNDFNIIKQKVVDGLAHELSEGDSVILGAARKGAKDQIQSQPFSDLPAKTRAFSLKNSFIKGVLREHRKNHTVISTQELTPEDWIWNRIKPYIGMTQLDILSKFRPKYKNAKSAPGSIGNMINKDLLGNEEDFLKNEIFSKLSYVIKSIPIYQDFTPIEKGTFKTLNKSDFETEWDDSDWKIFFEESTLLYIGYLGEDKNNTEIPHGNRKLSCLFKVTFTPEEVLVKPTK